MDDGHLELGAECVRGRTKDALGGCSFSSETLVGRPLGSGGTDSWGRFTGFLDAKRRLKTEEELQRIRVSWALMGLGEKTGSEDRTSQG